MQQEGEIGEEHSFKQAFDSFCGFVSAIKELRQQIQILKAHVAHTGRLTKTFEASKRRMLSHIDAFIAGATVFVSQSLIFIEDVDSEG